MFLNFIGSYNVDLLHQAKLRLWSASRCKAAVSYFKEETMICAGYESGYITTCAVSSFISNVSSFVYGDP